MKWKAIFLTGFPALLLPWILEQTARAQAPGDSPPPEAAHFHHIHLNVTDPEATMRFYQKVFGAIRVKYRDTADALFCERSFILWNKVATPPPWEMKSSIWHMGWGGVDVEKEYEWWKKHDVTFQTPLSPLPGKDNWYMYIHGPGKELIEVNTMGHHRFAHVHLFATDVNDVTEWYEEHLGLRARRHDIPRPTGDPSTLGGVWMNAFPCDNVLFIVFEKPHYSPGPRWWPDPPLKDFEPTKGRAIDHVAFSYRKIEPVFERLKKEGVEIVEPISVKEEFKMKSFFIMGPEKVLIEIVEEKPIPEGIWE